MTLDEQVAQLLGRIGLRPAELSPDLLGVVRQHLDPRPKEPPMADETLSEAAARYQRAIDSAAAAIDADPRRTAHDKDRAAALTWWQHSRGFESVRAVAKAAPRAEIDQLTKDHFGRPRGIINSTARELAEMNASKAHTDAAAVPVQNIGDELDRAIGLGADSLARALARRAYEHRQVDPLNRYLKAYPSEDEGVTRLWELRKQVEQDDELTSVVGAHFATKLEKPARLAGYSDYDIQRLAADAAPSTFLDPGFEQHVAAATIGTWRPAPSGPAVEIPAQFPRYSGPDPAMGGTAA